MMSVIACRLLVMISINPHKQLGTDGTPLILRSPLTHHVLVLDYSEDKMYLVREEQ